MSRAAALLRSHLISVHQFDWSNDAIFNRDLEAMQAMHAEDHQDLSAVGPVYAPIVDHPEGSRETGTAYSIKKANAKEKHMRETERERNAR